MEARASWNPKQPSAPSVHWEAGFPKGLVVHWVGGGAMLKDGQTHEDCRTSVRGIQNYEMSHGYTDLAYNTIACPHGILIEGRGLSYKGAANGGGTNGVYGSVCILAGQGDIITPGHYAAVLEARTLFAGVLLPHRSVNATSCPGGEITAWVKAQPSSGVISAPVTPPRTQSPSPGGGLASLYVALHNLATTIKTGRALKQGDKGQDVTNLQLFLIAVCGNTIKADGNFGPQTKVALTNFQRYFHLRSDGVFGPKSRALASYFLSVKFP